MTTQSPTFATIAWLGNRKLDTQSSMYVMFSLSSYFRIPTNFRRPRAWRTSTIERPLLHVTRKWGDGKVSTNGGGGEDEDGWEEEREQNGCRKPRLEMKSQEWMAKEWIVVLLSTMGIASVGKQQWVGGVWLGDGFGRLSGSVVMRGRNSRDRRKENQTNE